MVEDRIRLEPSWKQALGGEFDKAYMHDLREFLKLEKQTDKTIYPPGNEIFRALDLTPLPDVNVVVIGQDPYHGPGQAHGLCFSVQRGVRQPPSLKNIFKEIRREFADAANRLDGERGCLEPWSRQGVLLLNAVLTVERGQAGSHQGRGWESFTDAVVEVLNRERRHLVFLLWGSYAQKKAAMVDRNQHLVLSAPHPSPLSAHRGFFGCNHFHAANEYLEAHGREAVDWLAVE
jgi:uracil-DNA glycosylase